jgi:formate C-acetyltransferase
VGKLPTGAILGGVLLNQKLNPSTLENESDKQKLMVLLRTFFEVHKGWHIQYNIVSRERCWRRRNTLTSTAICGPRRRILGVLYRPVAGYPGRYHRPYRAYAVILRARWRYA